MPNAPAPRPASTSSEVLPARAISKSWIRAAPFMAREVIKPRRMRSMRIGPRPTLITWPPMPQRMGLRCLRAVWMAARRLRRSAAARKLGREARNLLREGLLAGGLAKSRTLTLLLRDARGYVWRWVRVMGLVE